MEQLALHDAPLIVEIEDGFVTGGTLGVKEGDKIIPVLVSYIHRFEAHGCLISLTLDWPPPNHWSPQK